MSNKTKYAVGLLAASAAFFMGVKVDEGYTSKPVIPVKGDRPTQGHGSTFKLDGSPVKITDPPITRATADKWLRNDVAKREVAFKDSLKGVKLSQTEYDIYLDFSYQYGVPTFSKSSMLKYLKIGQYKAACDSLLKYKYVAKRDCSIRKNGCYGVWTRQVERHAKCIGAQ
ncbi:phage lysozyme family protein [Acinetobacter sp. 25977_6]|uniref:glycoside hydrolase family protein n=1 Tax=unclassified Acinetobacter calcoaceticus/baumannii complex TaxID=2881046 RepID=UPI000446F977|nr:MULTISPECIES: glycoside hydrolase family protein [unclassified Acinetobacter calcoaceticus/baumannii complex]KCZ28789.1 phage lysozyme family protein [Acinetobacter baumannii 25977_9]EXT35546.1 phage lysozyme family protein [Acinetobacter sp. 25977_8]EXT43466.1 phage lysozyme family protein [Acinetobacter sp. 25977_6]EXT46685.1 phage lysozyme family protein [Acinetobacter sp. 25977_4]EXT51291.1 phage lysozyme family protein [Acinetobacter sp. 25977_3]